MLFAVLNGTKPSRDGKVSRLSNREPKTAQDATFNCNIQRLLIIAPITCDNQSRQRRLTGRPPYRPPPAGDHNTNDDQRGVPVVFVDETSAMTAMTTPVACTAGDAGDAMPHSAVMSARVACRLQACRLQA